MEAHERFKKEGAVLEAIYGTPQTAALNKKLEEDKILGTSPGFGTAAAADGKRYPYTFPIAASYWSQARGGGGVRQGEAGRQPQGQEDRLHLLRQSRRARSRWPSSRTSPKSEGFELRTFAVPAPGLEMGAQVLDITGRFKPDFVIAHLFGRAPSVAIKELKGKGFPLSKVIGFVWAIARRPTSSPPAAWAWPKATTPCSSPASARTSR